MTRKPHSPRGIGPQINAIGPYGPLIEKQTEPWGVQVRVVEIKDVEIPESMQRAMARGADAERERRAKVINARGELQASEELREAAETLAKSPASL